MIPELGHFALILALLIACLQITLPAYGVFKQQDQFLLAAPRLALCQSFFILLSYALLTTAFVLNDFSVLYIAKNSSSELPFVYRMSAVWGSHEGSMLLWVTILSLWTAAVALLGGQLDKRKRAIVLSVLGFISLGFLLFILFTSNPFLRLLPDFPVQGRDLNPLLQDPGFLIHPPMLYMGYVGFAVAFAFAFAALITGEFTANWAKQCRPWTLAAWCFLTFGITLGSWWAYRELGWGGWWFWDPVENASFMPWLVGTALLHSLMVSEKRDTFKAWTILLALFAFALSLLGTFLVRSGVLTSVHAFAVSPERGLFMLIFLFIVVASSLTLYAWRMPTIKRGGDFYLLSRETLLLSNNMILFVVMLTVLLGTLYPLIIDMLGLAKLSVGAPYFNTLFFPLMAPLLFLMGLGPNCYWREMKPSDLKKRMQICFFASIILGVALPYLLTGELRGMLITAVILSSWVFIATWQSGQGRRKTASLFAMALAHTGVAVTTLGIAISSAYSLERHIQIQPGDSAYLGAYRFQFDRESSQKGPNYLSQRAQFTLFKNGQKETVLYPEKRIYNISKQAMTDAAIDATLYRDVYIALGQPLENGAWSVRIYVKPFIRWIWAGGILMLLGGLIGLYARWQAKPRRHTEKDAQLCRA